MDARRHSFRRRASAVLLGLGAIAWGAVACCPETYTETCLTLESWRASERCPDFPATPDGAQCPPAEVVATNCDTEPGPSRTDGDKCCYQMPIQCI